jgi:hypothetical protein
MANARAWEDEYTLLCERCGYVVEGLPAEGACPECGKPIEESLPERRVGTPWQQSRSGANLARTWRMSLFHPIRTLSVLAESPVSDTRLRRWTTLASALLLSFSWWQYGAISVVREEPLSLLVLIALVLICAVALWPILLGLTQVETWGLGVIAKTRGFRVPINARRAITAHGCVGWLFAGVILCCVMVGLDVLHALLTKPYVEYDPSRPHFDNFEALYGRRTPLWLDWLTIATRVICLLAGFLFFETFAWLGLRRLKYANRTRPHKGPASGAES